MKNFFLLLIILLGFTGKASHLAGGDIQYRYIGDSTGIDHHYEVLLRVYRSCEPGASTFFCTTATVKSSCFNDQTINLVQKMNPSDPLGEFDPPTYEDCVTKGSVKCLKVRIFKGVVILPGKCQDFSFYWSCNARPPGIDNIQQPSNTKGFYFEATLNNFIGDNSSPFFVSEPARAFCINKPFVWKQSVLEADGDSIYFELSDPKTTAPLGAAIPFANGWSKQYPIRTNPANNFSLNPFSGVLSFTPASAETDVIAIIANEYRYDTLYNAWQKIGSANRELVAAIDVMCSPEAQMGVVIDTTQQGMYYDPINKLYTVDYECLDSSVVVHFLNKLECSSISADGTDFRLTSPDLQPIPIKSITSICDVNNESKTIIVKLHKPLATNGDYFLYSKLGNDGNTLVNKCGFEMVEFDTIQLRVENCKKLVMNLENVTIKDDQHPKIEWLTDQATFEPSLFDKIVVYRKDPGAIDFLPIGQVTDVNKQFYNDFSINAVDVDINSYEYQIQMLYAGLALPKTRSVHSILITTNSSSCDTVPLNWNIYNGWNNPNYTIEIGKADAFGNYTWSKHQNAQSGNNPTTSTNYILYSELPEGKYKIRVQTSNGNYTSISNWIDCSSSNLEIDEPKEVIVPNVLTPNGDGRNDMLYIPGIEEYQSYRKVTIYNRWGTTVFKTDQYTNQNPFNGYSSNGSPLSDGVYYITVELNNQATETLFNYKGTITLIKNK